MIGPRLTDSQAANFETLCRAHRAGALALVSCRYKDGRPVAVLCAVNTAPDGGVELVPLAALLDNPYDALENPCGDTPDTAPGGPTTGRVGRA